MKTLPSLIFLFAAATSSLVGCSYEERPYPQYPQGGYAQTEPYYPPQGGYTQPGGYAQPAPPPDPYEAQPPPPSRDYAWVKGHWRWTGRNYTWIGGHWDRRPRANASWFPGRWENRGPSWIWIDGGWRL